jgi:hypothetical protein
MPDGEGKKLKGKSKKSKIADFLVVSYEFVYGFSK